ncbi:MAG TPA: Crp/Fnr family transcriptional regulator [Vineibacter sp.]|nr:Crp/Fnr family transcriptional regulator [Vineibacter sp.]
MTDPPRGVHRRDILAGHEFFADLPDATLDRLAASSRTTGYTAGTLIFAKGDDGLGLLAVLSGIVKISVTAEDDREVELTRLSKGEVFGEIALLDGLPRTADAWAVTACNLLVLDRRDFLPMLAEEPAMAVRLLETISRRLRRTDELVESLSFEAPELRLAKALFRLAEAQGVAAAAQPRVAITQRELGQIVRLSRESTNKHLREWELAGLIRLEKGACVLCDPVAFRRRQNLSP